MRYLGNKQSMLSEIDSLLKDKGLLNKRLIFFDAFCGSGSVAEHYKDKYDLIINDNLRWAVVYSRGRICSENCKFERLKFNPFEFLNGCNTKRTGFIYDNYAPTSSQRMYFTIENASRIDYFRFQIEEWYKNDLLTEDEYNYLLACLIESVSKVSNTAGVYGAFLKKWDSRALKPIIFDNVDSKEILPLSVASFNDKIENIIENVDCDILYLDPPYTQNQYGTQYHLLETLILDDHPSISSITGSRPTAPMRSDWSKEFKVNIVFDKVLAKTKAKYVILSYNNDGFMSKEYIEAALKRYGKPETYCCRKIVYKKYQNWKSQNQEKHFEYLFFVELKNKEDVVYESPLNYIGSKAKVIVDIRCYKPKHYTKMFDAFCGGFNVGINIPGDLIFCNDLNNFVVSLIKCMKDLPTYEFIAYVKKTIQKFGLEKSNSDAYLNAREFYNSLPFEKRDPRLLFTIVMYGFQQQIRFNSNHDFNNPVGMRWFNDKILEKLISFSRVLKEKKIVFSSKSYNELLPQMDDNSFVYFDPPYLLTNGSYNDGKRGFNGWNDILENELFEFADMLNKKSIPFMLSYVAEHKGAVNNKLLTWVETNNYKLIQLGDIVGISGKRRKEVLIINYDICKQADFHNQEKSSKV